MACLGCERKLAMRRRLLPVSVLFQTRLLKVGLGSYLLRPLGACAVQGIGCSVEVLLKNNTLSGCAMAGFARG
jgi:hypothetical protein